MARMAPTVQSKTSCRPRILRFMDPKLLVELFHLAERLVRYIGHSRQLTYWKNIRLNKVRHGFYIRKVC